MPSETLRIPCARVRLPACVCVRVCVCVRACARARGRQGEGGGRGEPFVGLASKLIKTRL